MPADLSASPLLQMQGISKRFGPVQALSGVNLNVRGGSVHALCGENGAGKSTLMKILAGIHAPDEGTILLQGQPLSLAEPSDALRAGISMIFQELDLAPDLTVAENIFLGAEPAGPLAWSISRRSMVAQTRELAARYEFTIDPEKIVSDLPVGDCQIVEVLKALRRKASIIVLDEPTSSLSAAESQRLFAVIQRLRREGLALIYISHRLDEVFSLADDISVLRDGRVVHTAPAAALDISTVVHHMVGRELTDFFPPRTSQPGAPCLRVDNLSSDEGVRDVSFTVRRGEIVGLAGLMGAGRTEVARALFGVEPPTAGEITLDGTPLRGGNPADSIDAGLVLLTEDRRRTGLCLDLPCAWNITLPNLDRLGMARVLQPERELAVAAEAGTRMNVRWGSPSNAARSLSGGNQQKLLVARWVMAEARCLIFDEPTRGIDVGAKREIYLLLDRLAAEGKAILLISSELPELFGVADRILVMRRGRLVGDLVTTRTTPAEVMRLAAVE
jgi:ABC-type sugar transport system ATPase subunit